MFPKELAWPIPEQIDPNKIAEQIKTLIEKAKNAGYIISITKENYGTRVIYINDDDNVNVEVYK